MTVSFLSERAAKRVRRFRVRSDIVDASCYLESTAAARAANGTEKGLQVFVSVRLVNRLKRLGTEAGIEKLRQVVNRGVAVMWHNNGNKKSNFIIDLVPTEYFTVERYRGEQVPGLVIDFEPLQAGAGMKLANG